MLAHAYVLHEFTVGRGIDIGPFRAQTSLLPHWLPNAGARHLVLTHLLPGTDAAAAQAAAGAGYDGEIGVAASGLVLDLS